MSRKLAASKRDDQTRPPKQSVTVTTVDPEVLAVAWHIAGGNSRRIQVIDHNTIKVHNHAWR